MVILCHNLYYLFLHNLLNFVIKTEFACLPIYYCYLSYNVGSTRYLIYKLGFGGTGFMPGMGGGMGMNNNMGGMGMNNMNNNNNMGMGMNNRGW